MRLSCHVFIVVVAVIGVSMRPVPAAAQRRTVRCASTEEQRQAREAEQLLAQYYRLGRFDGAALVARGDCVLMSRAWGLANRDWNVANTPATLFRIGSITKAVTAAAVHRLALAGRLDLDAPAARYLPRWDTAATRRYTVRQLLWHRSGLPDFNDDLEFFAYVQNRDTPWDSVVARAARSPLQFEPGTGFGYSNNAYWLLGAILETVTGRSWIDALDSLVLAPLGLGHTVADAPRGIVTNRSTGYRDAFDGITVALPYRATGDAGLWSTTEDLYHLLRGLSDPRRTPEALRAALFEDRPDGNAQGWFRDTVRFAPSSRSYRVFRQDGAVYGFFATTFLIPEPEWVIVLLTNYRRPYNSLREIAMGLGSLLDGGAALPAAATLGNVVESIRQKSGVSDAIACLEQASCRGTAAVNETELNVWAWFQAERGAPAEAARAFHALTALFPTATATWYGLAYNALAAGDSVTARRAVDELLRLAPTHAGGLRLRARLKE